MKAPVLALRRSDRRRPFRGHTLSLAVAILVFIGPGCDGAGPDASPPAAVLVVNQGNFNDGNGSVTSYDPRRDLATTMVSGLSSIVQSGALSNDRLYIAANSGGRVDVFDLEGQQVGQFSGLRSPRYLAFFGEDRAYVTNLFKDNFTGGTVSVLNLTSGAVDQTIEVGENPEGVAVSGPTVFVANHEFGAGRSVSILSTVHNAVIQTIALECDGPRSVFVDARADVIIVCTGETVFDEDFNIVGQTNGSIVQLNGADGSLIDAADLSGQAATVGPGQDAYLDVDSDRLFVVVDRASIAVFDVATRRFLDVIGPLAGDPIGAIAFEPEEERLYVGRVPSFTTSGSVTIHELDGTQVGSFLAGVAPTHILFSGR